MSLPFELQRDKGLRENGLFQPFKIVSLMELLEFYADLWLTIFCELGKHIAIIELDEKLRPELQQIRMQSGVSLDFSKPSGTSLVKEELYVNLVERLEDLELTESAMCAEEILDSIRTGKYKTSHSIKPKVNELLNIIRYQLRSRLILMLPQAKLHYYDDILKVFSFATREAFPSAFVDMTEACKCFALGRDTACVFHLMRVLEAGLNTLSKDLCVPIGRNWNTALDMIEKEIRSRSTKTHGQQWKLDEPFYSEAATHFRFIKNAWRNYVAHLHEHYNEERARGILDHVGGFMRHLATRLNEAALQGGGIPE
jgi:hypothetical protein